MTKIGLGRHRVAPEAAAVLELIARLREQAERALAAPVQVVACYEAGRDGFWLHRVLSDAGIENHVVDPTSLLVDRRARRVKTDRLDAEALLRALMAWRRGERRVCSMVRVPSVEAEDSRRTTRERANLVKERVRHVNRIKGLLATQGIYDFLPLRPDALARLEALVTGDGRPLPERLKAERDETIAAVQGKQAPGRVVALSPDRLDLHRGRAQGLDPGRARRSVRGGRQRFGHWLQEAVQKKAPAHLGLVHAGLWSGSTIRPDIS